MAGSRALPAIGRTPRFGRIKTPAHLFAGFKIRHRVFLNRNDRSSARVAPGPCQTMLDRKVAEAEQFDPIAARHCGADRIENGAHDVFDVTMQEVRVLAG